MAASVPSAVGLVVANLAPLVGVLFFGWSLLGVTWLHGVADIAAAQTCPTYNRNRSAPGGGRQSAPGSNVAQSSRLTARISS